MYIKTALLPLRRLWPALAYGLHRLAPSHYWLVALRADYFGCAALAHALYVLVWLAQPAQAHLPPLLSCVGGSSHGAFFSPAEAGDYFRRLLVRLGLRVAYVALHFWPDGRLDFHLLAPSHDRGVALRRTAAAVRQFCRAAARQTTGELNRARLRWGLHTVANFSPAGFVYYLDELPGELLRRAVCGRAPALVKTLAEPTAAVADLLRPRPALLPPPSPPATARTVPAANIGEDTGRPAAGSKPAATGLPTTTGKPLAPVLPGPTAVEEEDEDEAGARRRREAEKRDADLRRRVQAQEQRAAAQLDLFCAYYPEPDVVPPTPTASRQGPTSATPAPAQAPVSRTSDPTPEFDFGPPPPIAPRRPKATPGTAVTPLAPPVRPKRCASQLLALGEPLEPADADLRYDWARCTATLLQNEDRLVAVYGDRLPATLGALHQRARTSADNDADACEFLDLCEAFVALLAERRREPDAEPAHEGP